MTRLQQRLVNVVLTLLFLAFYVVSFNSLAHFQSNEPQNYKTAGVWDLSPVMLQMVAGEFKGLMADYLTLDVGAQLGTEVIRDAEGEKSIVIKEMDCNLALKKFQASQTLDPSFAHNMILAQGWLPWDCQMVDDAMIMLEGYQLNRPWDWQPARFLAFNNYYFLNDRAEAGRIFLEAAQKDNAPDYFSLLGTRLLMEGGQTETALWFVQSMLHDMPEDDPGYKDLSERHQVLLGVQVLTKAKNLYQQKFGKQLYALSDLVSSGVLLQMPVNPYHVEYCLDLDGLIHFDNVNCEKIPDHD